MSEQRPAASAESLGHLEADASVGPISHLPLWREVLPERVEPGVCQLLAETERAFAELENGHQCTWEDLMVPLERLQVRLGRVLGRVAHLLSVKYSDPLQAAYDAVRPDYIALLNRMAQSRPVYEGMVALRDGPQWPSLDAAQQRIVSESIRDMERSGVHLEGAEKARYLEIDARLAELSNRFQTNLVKEEQASRIKVTDAAQLDGVPPALRELAAQTAVEDGVAGASPEQGPWHFVVNGVNYMAIAQHCADRALRESFYRAFRARGTSDGFDNRPLLDEMLHLRQEQSRLVGFDNYAELSVDAKMAPSVDSVWSLLRDLEAAARPAAERELDELMRFMRDERDPEADALAPWDVAFFSERLRQARFGYDSERLRDYFQMPRVLDGLFSLVARLYDVHIVRSDADTPVWDDSVTFYEVRRDGRVIAAFYVDPYARPGEKRGGAWMNTVVNRSRVLAPPGQSSTLPVALFVMNARPPSGQRPALMSLDEVRTLFHEFGHATQHMFTEIEEGGASGMNLVEWDAVELASQFNEYWMDHKPFLKSLTAQVDSGEPLDDATLERIIDSRNFMIGNATLRQLQFAKTDLALHQRYGLPGSNDSETPFEIEQDIARETLVAPTLPGETQLPAFGHLFAGGYAAGYYSYKWAEVLAADAFAAFREAGLDDDRALHEVAARFRDTVLALGGSLPAREVYRRFRGRDANADALLLEQGLKVA
ncbi:MAG: M3 family metallopeptidase [Pseudomonadales bacterium]